MLGDSLDCTVIYMLCIQCIYMYIESAQVFRPIRSCHVSSINAKSAHIHRGCFWFWGHDDDLIWSWGTSSTFARQCTHNCSHHFKGCPAKSFSCKTKYKTTSQDLPLSREIQNHHLIIMTTFAIIWKTTKLSSRSYSDPFMNLLTFHQVK